jgi:hypothetical protein
MTVTPITCCKLLFRVTIGEQCNNEKKVNDRSFCISWAVVGVGRRLVFSSVKRFRIWSVRNFSFIVHEAPYKYKTYCTYILYAFMTSFSVGHIFKIPTYSVPAMSMYVRYGTVRYFHAGRLTS